MGIPFALPIDCRISGVAAPYPAVEGRFRLAIHAYDLLTAGVRHSGEDARLRHGVEALQFLYPRDRNMLVPEALQQHLAGFIHADCAYGQHIDTEIREIVGRVGAATWHDSAVAMLQNQNWGLARDTRNLAEDEFVGYHVTEYGNRDIGERLNDLLQTLEISRSLQACPHSPDCWFYSDFLMPTRLVAHPTP
jgi:hypothetical protein